MYSSKYFCVEIKAQVITVALLQLATNSASTHILTSPNDELLFIMVILMCFMLSTKEERNIKLSIDEGVKGKLLLFVHLTDSLYLVTSTPILVLRNILSVCVCSIDRDMSIQFVISIFEELISNFIHPI